MQISIKCLHKALATSAKEQVRQSSSGVKTPWNMGDQRGLLN
jgi:hypothetical protein